MAPYVSIEKLDQHVDQEVIIKGWLYNRRTQGKLIFPIIRDGSGFVQGVIFKGDFDEATFSQWDKLPYESAVEVVGKVVADKRAQGGVEVQLKKLQVLSVAEEYPISLQEHGPDFLLAHRHLWLRSKKPWAEMRVRHTIIRAIHEYFDMNGFTQFDAPILTPNACEGTSTLFGVKYFEEGMAYLTQSGQLYGEAGAFALGKVYVFGPCFRAEKSKTRKHLTEFWMVEPEIAFATLADIMDTAEAFLCHIVKRVLEKRRLELQVLGRDITKLEAIKPPFPRYTYKEAVQIMQEKGHAFQDGSDLGSPDEQALTDGHATPIMISHWPAPVKAFYMATDPNDKNIALGVDVLAPEGYGEIIGGGERSTDLPYLLKQIEKEKLNEEDFKWYLDLRRYGTVPHGGFGLGLERTITWICGTEHIREAIPFPRMIYRIYP